MLCVLRIVAYDVGRLRASGYNLARRRTIVYDAYDSVGLLCDVQYSVQFRSRSHDRLRCLEMSCDV
eukprot:3726513-Lingulodinium_polyedra.AAC.1